jgi:ADP-heptose:LPS heptosyltransferase
LPAWTSERAWAAQWLVKAGLHQPWLLNVGAGWPTKVWPKQRQIEFAKAVKTRGKPLLLLWGNHQEHDLAEEIVTEARHGVLAPPTSIPQLAGMIAHGAVLVSGDTGPLHLGLALGTPAIGLFGPVPAERNGPRGRGYRTFQAPGAAWERNDVARVDMGTIAAFAVVEAAAAMISEAAP